MPYIVSHFRIDSEDYAILQAEARALGISVPETVRRAVRRHLDERRTETAAEAPAAPRAPVPPPVPCQQRG